MTVPPKNNELGKLFHLASSRLVTLLPREINSTDLPVLADHLSRFIIESDYQGKSDMKWDENNIAGKVTANTGLRILQGKKTVAVWQQEGEQKRKRNICFMYLVFLWLHLTYSLVSNRIYPVIIYLYLPVFLSQEEKRHFAPLPDFHFHFHLTLFEHSLYL